MVIAKLSQTSISYHLTPQSANYRYQLLKLNIGSLDSTIRSLSATLLAEFNQYAAGSEGLATSHGLGQDHVRIILLQNF